MSNKDILDCVEELIDAEKTQDALLKLETVKDVDTVRYLLLKGRIEQKFQNWGGAINAFNRVLEIDESNKEAQNSLQLIQGILDFWNPDMYNP